MGTKHLNMEMKKELRKAHYSLDNSFFCVIPEINYLLRTTDVNKHLTPGLHKVAHGIIKREATYPYLKFYDMIFAQFICSNDSFVMCTFQILGGVRVGGQVWG